jgi:hypothetical protein
MSTPGYEWGGDDEDFLSNFGITKSSLKSDTSSDTATPANNAQNESGQYVTYSGNPQNGEISGKPYTSSTVGDNVPYLLTPDRLIKYGLGNEYLNGIIYKKRIYRPDEIKDNVELNGIMQDVVTINNSATNPSDLHNRLSKIINYTDYDPTNYTYYNPEQSY